MGNEGQVNVGQGNNETGGEGQQTQQTQAQAQAQGNNGESGQVDQTGKGNQQSQIVDIEKAGKDAISKMLKDFGVEDADALKAIVDKAKADEESKLSDSEKKDKQLEVLTKKLAASEKACMLAESKLAALKLGAKPELVDDLVAVAVTRASKDKDVSAVISEIKEGSTGNVYFGVSEPAGSVGGTRRNLGSAKKGGEENEGKNGGKSFGFAKSIAESMKSSSSKKSTYFS